MNRRYLESRLLKLPVTFTANGQTPSLAAAREQVHDTAGARARRDAFMERERTTAGRVLALSQAVGLEERVEETGRLQKSAIVPLFPARDNHEGFTGIGARLYQIFAPPRYDDLALRFIRNSIGFVAYGSARYPERVLEWQRSFDHQAHSRRLSVATPAQINALTAEGIFACQAEFETELTALEAIVFDSVD